jgi:hypothetical protein
MKDKYYAHFFKKNYNLQRIINYLNNNKQSLIIIMICVLKI